MTYQQCNDTYIVRLFPGEEVVETLTIFCKQHNITGGWISGLGGAREVELSSFNMTTNQYDAKLFQAQLLEVTNITGNISVEKLHVHVTIGDDQGRAWAGHCNRIVTDPTMEICITQLPDIHRTLDHATGLQLLDLSSK